MTNYPVIIIPHIDGPLIVRMTKNLTKRSASDQPTLFPTKEVKSCHYIWGAGLAEAQQKANPAVDCINEVSLGGGSISQVEAGV